MVPISGVEPPDGDLRWFFSRSLDLFCIAGIDGYFERLNPAWTSCLGWSKEELQARPFLDFVHPEDREVTLAEVEKLAQGAETSLFENRYLHRDGSYRWLQWNASPAPGKRRICALARDVTRRRRLQTEILEVADQEKERLGQDLHDGLCQTLAGIAALSSSLSRKLDGGSRPSESAQAAEITQLLNEAIGQARDMARGLVPRGVGKQGLPGALEALVFGVQKQLGVACTVEGDRTLGGINDEVQAHLFRIAQEAVNNAVSHGRARRVQIDLGVRDGRGLLSIRDDGVGLPRDMKDQEGIGMHTMAYRARLVGGSLALRRRAGRGLAVECLFPLAESPEGD